MSLYTNMVSDMVWEGDISEEKYIFQMQKILFVYSCEEHFISLSMTSGNVTNLQSKIAKCKHQAIAHSQAERCSDAFYSWKLQKKVD